MRPEIPARHQFRERVQALRDSWEERREVRPLAASFDLDSQCRLLAVLHNWAEDCAAIIRSIYGQQFDLVVESLPGGEPHAFSVRLGGVMSLTFALTQRRRQGSSLWTISAHVSAIHRGFLVPVDPERRNGPWSRARLENLILSLLGAYERSRTGLPRRLSSSASPAAG